MSKAPSRRKAPFKKNPFLSFFHSPLLYIEGAADDGGCRLLFWPWVSSNRVIFMLDVELWLESAIGKIKEKTEINRALKENSRHYWTNSTQWLSVVCKLNRLKAVWEEFASFISYVSSFFTKPLHLSYLNHWAFIKIVKKFLKDLKA